MLTDDQINEALLGDQVEVRRMREEINAAPARAVAAVEERLEFKKAVDWFEGEYSQELADPHLKSLLYAKDAELAAKNPQMTYRARLQMVGDTIREWHRRTAGKRTDSGPSYSDTTENVERDVSQRRPAANTRAAVREDLDGEPSAEEVSDVIQQMARSRGQNVAAKYVWKVRG